MDFSFTCLTSDKDAYFLHKLELFNSEIFVRAFKKGLSTGVLQLNLLLHFRNRRGWRCRQKGGPFKVFES